MEYHKRLLNKDICMTHTGRLELLIYVYEIRNQLLILIKYFPNLGSEPRNIIHLLLLIILIILVQCFTRDY